MGQWTSLKSAKSLKVPAGDKRELKLDGRRTRAGRAVSRNLTLVLGLGAHVNVASVDPRVNI